MEVVDSDEEYLDDPIKLIDYEQYRFGMAAQGFDAFKQVIPNKTQTYFLNRETLLNTVCDAHKCKPMSVQLVDCIKYHRYYKLKPKKGMGRYQLQKTLKRKTIKKVSNRKQSAGNFDKAAVSNCMDKTNFAKKCTYRRICNKTNEVSLKDVEIDTCYSPNQLNQTFENKEVFDNRTEPSKLFNQDINSTGNLPVIEHVFSLNCSMVRETLNNQYDYEDKRRLRNVINLINLYRSTEKVKESHNGTSYNGASVECGSETAMPRFTNNVNEAELQVKENQMLDVIDIDTEDNIKPNNTTNGSSNSEKEFDDPKKIDNFSDINKYRPLRDFKGYYKKSDVIRIVPKYRSSTPLPCNCSAQSLNLGKLGVHQLFIPQVSRLCIQSSKPKRNLSQPNECSESETNNKIYLPCIYLKSLKNLPGVSSVDSFGDNNVMKDRDIIRNPEPDEVINNNLYKSNVSKGYSPPILPIPTYATLLDCFSQFRSKLLYKSNGELPTLRTVLEKSKLMNM